MRLRLSSLSMAGCRSVAGALVVLAVAAPARADEENTSRWYAAEVTIEIAPGPGAGDELADVLAAAANAWNDEGLGPLLVTAPHGRHAAQGDGRNTLELVRRDWPAAPDRLAVTRKLKRGDEILEADIFVNVAGFPMSLAGDEKGTWDVQSLLTHELGHLLGLPHLTDEDATMHAEQRAEEQLRRDLAPPDVEALAARYLEGLDDGGARRAGGCAATSGADNTTLSTAALLLAAAVRRRRRR